jgi:hypothetical protein
LRIETAVRVDENPTKLMCTISWDNSLNSKHLFNTVYENSVIKEKYPLLLIEYYERHLKFPRNFFQCKTGSLSLNMSTTSHNDKKRKENK